MPRNRLINLKILSLGTACILLRAAPAAAASPDTGIDWSAEVAAAKPPPKPAPRPPRRPPRAAAAPIAETPPVDTAAVITDIPAVITDIPTAPVAPPPVVAAPDLAPRTPMPYERQLPATRVCAQLVAGAALALGGVAGLSVMANGLHVHRISERELARGGAYPAELLAPLESQHDRSEARIAAGAVAGVVGLALGTALIVSGVRERKVGRRAHAHLRVAPTFGGVLLTGRF